MRSLLPLDILRPRAHDVDKAYLKPTAMKHTAMFSFEECLLRGDLAMPEKFAIALKELRPKIENSGMPIEFDVWMHFVLDLLKLAGSYRQTTEADARVLLPILVALGPPSYGCLNIEAVAEMVEKGRESHLGLSKPVTLLILEAYDLQNNDHSEALLAHLFYLFLIEIQYQEGVPNDTGRLLAFAEPFRVLAASMKKTGGAQQGNEQILLAK